MIVFFNDRFGFNDVLDRGRRVFLAGLDGATSVAPSSVGSVTSNDMPSRDQDEDFLDWARRAMQYAHAKIIQAIGSNGR